MKEHPILFSAPMVRAILEGRKTQTRRVVKPRKDVGFGCLLRPNEIAGEINSGQYENSVFGQPGDRLWVRENCQGWAYEAGGHAVRYPADGGYKEIKGGLAEYERWLALCTYARKKHAIVPSIHMPRWASRILLEITNVRVELLHGISVDDAIAEGCAGGQGSMPDGMYDASPDEHFMHVWESTYPGSWNTNPWVWVVEFKQVKP